MVWIVLEPGKWKRRAHRMRVDFFCTQLHPKNKKELGVLPNPLKELTGGKGVEPLFTESESVVLPLNDPPTSVSRKWSVASGRET